MKLEDDNTMHFDSNNDQEDDSIFDAISHKWQNFVERSSEILGYDGYRYE